MKLISFDVGIKNMAYCILDLQGSQLNINNWGILNLMDDENISYTCDCKNKPKNKKTPPTNCSKKAKYHKNDKYYCEKHAKECSQYMIPTDNLDCIGIVTRSDENGISYKNISDFNEYIYDTNFEQNIKNKILTLA